MFFALAGIILSVLGIFVVSATNALAEENEELKIYNKRQHLISSVDNPHKLKPSNKLEKPKLDIQKSLARAETNTNINNLYAYLNPRNPSVFDRNIVSIIVRESERLGADYRIVTAIMGKESGFCRANYKIYNCFGYLNGVQYSSYEEAFQALVPKVAYKVAKHNWNLRGVAAEYRPVDQEGWAKRVYQMALKVY